MKKRARLLTGFDLSEISIVDKAACDLADITSVALVKRSDMNEPQWNSEALKAANIQPEEVGALRKLYNFLFVKPEPAEPKGLPEEEREAILAQVKDPALHKELDTQLRKWRPMLADAAGSNDGYSTPSYVSSIANDVTHKGLIPPSGSLPDNANPGKDKDMSDAGGNVAPRSDDMGQAATNAAVTDVRTEDAKADSFTGGQSGNRLDGYNIEGRKKKADETDDLEKREFSQAERDAAAESGAAMSDGSYPIKSVEDLKNAIQENGRGKNPAKTRAHIKSRARALGAANLIPDDWKADEATDLGMIARAAMAIDDCISDADADSALGKQLSQLRDQAGKLLVQTLAQELGEVGDDEKMTNVEDLAKSLLDAMHKQKGAQEDVEKQGAKFSAADAATMRAMKASFTKAHGHIGKAKEKYADDGDIDDADAHMTKGFDSFSKIDFEGRSVQGSDLKPWSADDATAPSKASDTADLRKMLDEAIGPVKSELGEVKSELTKSREAAHKLEVENAGLKAKLEAYGSMPVTPRIRVGGIVTKGSIDANIANRAGAAPQGPDLSIQPGDERQLIKGDMTVGFNKAFSMARRDPISIDRTPNVGGAN